MNEHTIKELKGFSGSKIYLMRNDNGLFVRKMDNVDRNFVKLNPKYSHRVSVLDTRFNMGTTEYKDRYRLATKPIKVVHFSADDERQWNIFANGDNEYNVPFISDRLKKIMNKHPYAYKSIGEVSKMVHANFSVKKLKLIQLIFLFHIISIVILK